MINILKLSNRSKNIPTKVQKPFWKAGNQVYSIILVNFHVPWSESGSASPIRIRIRDSHINTGPDPKSCFLSGLPHPFISPQIMSVNVRNTFLCCEPAYVFRRELFPRPGAGTTPGWNAPPLPPATSVPPSVLCPPPQPTVARILLSSVCVWMPRVMTSCR